MLRLAADENLIAHVLRGLLRRNPKIDIVRIQDVGVSGADDPEVLAWAAAEHRIFVTHDSRTVPRYAHQRVAQGHPMPGVFVVPQSLSVGRAIEDITLLCECASPEECEGLVLRLPL
jgi:hypothetical protein